MALAKGQVVTIENLEKRGDLNGKKATLLAYVPDVDRWCIQVQGTNEQVRVKTKNLEKSDDSSGVYVKANVDGKEIVLDPAELKKEFTKIVAKYGFDAGSKADDIADFLTSEDTTRVNAADFASRFSTTEQDASIFLAWINVGVAFKEQFMTNTENASDADREEAMRIAKASGLV